MDVGKNYQYDGNEAQPLDLRNNFSSISNARKLKFQNILFEKIIIATNLEYFLKSPSPKVMQTLLMRS